MLIQELLNLVESADLKTVEVFHNLLDPDTGKPNTPGVENEEQLKSHLATKSLELIKFKPGTATSGHGGADFIVVRGTEEAIRKYFASIWGMDPNQEEINELFESVELTEKVFDEDKYDWYVWTEKKPTKPFERRGGAKQIERGMQFGLRAATSKPGTWRLVLKQNGPSIIFSIEARDAQMLIDAALKLK